MITALVAYTESFDALADVTVPVLRKYCHRQGYDLIVHRGGFGDQSRQFGFQKTELVASLLPGTGSLFVVDVDTMITNHDVRLESFMECDADVFFTRDCNGINAGSYLIRNSQFSRAFLNAAFSQSGKPEYPGEQDVMRELIELPQVKPGITILPHPSINSYLYHEYGQSKTHEEGQWQPGDFLLHLPGMTNKRRIEIFRSL